MGIWERVIELSICEELTNYMRLGIDVNRVEEEDRLKTVVFNQLGQFAHLLQEFGVDKGLTGEVISKYGCRYDLQQEDLDTLMANV
jgi:hypothetical protein